MRHRLGVVLLVAQPLATELDGLRRALGSPERARVAPHLTLVSPTNVADRDLTTALAAVRDAAGSSAPLRLVLGPPASFTPITPTVHLAVGGDDLAALTALRQALVAVPPFERPDTHEWIPHVTLTQELAPPERIRQALAALAGMVVETTFERVHVLRQQDDRSWAPLSDSPLGAPGVVGRGGLEIELTRTARPEPEAAALLATDASPDGRPFAVTARLGGSVAGAAWGWVAAGTCVVADLAVAEAHRNLGVGRHLLAAVVDHAVAAGCDDALVVAPARGASGALLAAAGWTVTGGEPLAGDRRVWRRALLGA